MDWIIKVLNNVLIPLTCAVCLESLVYLLQYLIKNKKEDRNKYFKIFISSLLFYISFNLSYEIGYRGSFMDGVFRFVTSLNDFITYAVYGCVYYLLFYLLLLIYFSIRKKKEAKSVIFQRMSTVFGILAILSVIAFVSF